MAKQDLSIPQLMNRCRTEADAYQLLEELRWGNEPVCPHCGTIDRATYINPVNGESRRTRTGSVSERRVWKCNACRKQFSVLTDTFFHGTKISIRTWVLVILEMCASKNGVAAREIERKYDVTNKTAWFMLHRIREAMKEEPLAGLLAGTIVADETFIGGNVRNNRGRGRTGGTPAWAREDNKTAVLSLVDRATGEVRSKVIPDVTGASLRKVIADQVSMANTDLETDEAKGYKKIAGEFRSHKTVNHDADEWVGDEGQTTNPAESYFSQLKRSIDGTFHHVSSEHLPRYLAQFDFLRTWAETTDSVRMRAVLANAAGRRLTYKPLTGDA